MTEAWERLVRVTAEWGIPLTPQQLEQFRHFAALLLAGQEEQNLMGRVGLEELVDKHFLDSLAPLPFLDLPPKSKVADVGSGGGFPGIPLALVRPEWEFCLLDSLRKRIAFLQQVQQELALSHVYPIAARAEEVGKGELRESFSLVTARAVAPLPVLAELCLPLTQVGGIFLAYKGPRAEEELEAAGSALAILGGEVERVEDLALPAEKGTRRLIFIKKVVPTPPAYPRRPGIPAKRPL